MKRTLPIVVPSLIALTFLISSCKPSSTTPSNTSTPTTQSSPTPEETPERMASKAGTHCGDSPPANPKNCKLNIDQPFNVGCNLPLSGGPSHDIDLHCPNEGCPTTHSHQAQHTINHNHSP